MSVLSRLRWPITLGVSAISALVLLLAFPAFALANVALTQISSDPFTRLGQKAPPFQGWG
jgi:hypothetical protein